MSDDRLVLALNPGSSSLKATLRAAAPVVTFGVDRLGSDRGTLSVTPAGGAPHTAPFRGDIGAAVDAVAARLAALEVSPEIVAHRVVQGGPKHYLPTIVDDALLADLEAAVPLAPLHLPADLAAIRHARRAWPHAAHVACFDTGFHHDLPEAQRRLPVSAAATRAGVRRYGFHGLSIQSVLHAHPDLGGAVIAHLGSGCSVSGVQDGRPRYTTMSLTPTGGMISATRTGDLDPEIILMLLQHGGATVDELRLSLDHDCGLAGLAGGRHDVRDLLAADDPAAALALTIFCDSAARGVTASAAALDRWDALVFTGGVGEHAEAIRAAICARVAVVRGAAPADSGIRMLVVPADEEGVMDRSARALVPNAPLP